MRRVVVTGIGMVSPLATGAELTWSRLIAGGNAAGRIEGFEIDDLACQIACQITRGDGADGTFNPDLFMEPKEQRKVDDFHHLRHGRGEGGAGRRRLASGKL